MNRRSPRPLAVALEAVAGRIAPATPLARVQGVWEAVVGEAIAAHGTPVAERGGVLQVACDEAVWAAELELMAPDLLERLEQARPGLGITSMRFRTDLRATPRFP